MSRRTLWSSIPFLVGALCATSVSAQVVEFVPVSSTGPSTISGNEIVIPQGGVQIQFDIMVSGWGDAPGSPDLGAFGIGFDPSSLLGTNAIPPNPGVDLFFPARVPCTSADDCATGGCGSFESAFCDDNQPAFQFTARCLDDASEPCASGGTCSGTPVCIPNLGFLLVACSPAYAVAIPPSGNFEWIAACGSGSIPDPGVPKFGGSLRVDVPTGAGGTYTIVIEDDPDVTVLFDREGLRIPGLTRIAGTIRLTADCNDNGVPDEQDIAAGTSPDCNGNGVPDECEPEADCNDNGRPDECDIALLFSSDCNGNALPDECEPDGDCNDTGDLDECDIAGGTSDDCDSDGVPDECQPDCNGNGTADTCDLSGGSEDCNENSIPDECEQRGDCDNDGVQDICEVFAGADDCNFNNVPDECEPDEDCNTNGVRDICDIGADTEDDCNRNNIPDFCDLRDGPSPDDNGNGIPDECDARTPAVAFSPHDRTKNRFISFLPNNPDPVAIRVEWIQRRCADTGWDCFAHADCEPAELCEELGTVQLGWVGEPFDASTLPFSTAPVGTFTAHVVAEPALVDWTAFDVIHLGDCEIAPIHRYALSATADPAGDLFSDPLFLQTTAKPEIKFWGDVAGQWTGTEWTGPNELVNINDVIAWIFAFTSKPAPHITAVDLTPEIPNFIINVSDLGMIYWHGFLGMRYPPPAFANQGTVADCP